MASEIADVEQFHETVEMQWTGGNPAEMKAWAGPNFLDAQHGRPAAVSHLCDDGTWGWRDLEIGDVVVRGGSVWVSLGGDFPVKRGPIYTVRRPDRGTEQPTAGRAAPPMTEIGQDGEVADGGV